MADRFFPDKHIENAPVARPVSRRVLAWLGIVVVAGALVASGFIISARQHFEAISLGYQSEELRRQSTQLDEKLRQLELEYARAASPVEIEKRAKKIGLESPDKKTADNTPVGKGPKNPGPLAASPRTSQAPMQKEH
ncbi:MAG: hypothetical protein AABO41_03870 [Acidobacteriota bacterium]